MKPLQLTWFDKKDGVYQMPDGDYLPEWYVDEQWRDTKRLNDLELTAEYWHAETDHILNWHSEAVTFTRHIKDTLHRFANTPNHDKDDTA